MSVLRRPLGHVLLTAAVFGAVLAAPAPVSAQEGPYAGVPVSSAPAPNLPPMPPLPALPSLVPLSVREGLNSAALAEAAAATSTTSLGPIGDDREAALDDTDADDDTAVDAELDDSSSTSGSEEDPLASAARFSSAMVDMGVPGFNVDGSLAANPLGGVDAMGRLTERYTTLGSTLTGFYALQTGKPLPEFVESNSSTLASVLGTKPTKSAATSLTALSDQLASSGASPLAGASDFNEYASRLAARSDSVDSQVALAGLAWAKEMSSFRGASGQLTPEALAFSGVLSASLTSMVGQFPDVFAQVRSSGVGSPAAANAWRTSMLSSVAGTNRSLDSMMPNRCFSTMMTAMASGSSTAANRSGSSCGSCLSTGLYLNRQLTSLFTPGASSTVPNRSDSLLPPAEWNAMPSWQRSIVSKQNPSFATAAAAAPPSTSGCSGSSSQVRQAAAVTLPSMFSALKR